MFPICGMWCLLGSVGFVLSFLVLCVVVVVSWEDFVVVWVLLV